MSEKINGFSDEELPMEKTLDLKNPAPVKNDELLSDSSSEEFVLRPDMIRQKTKAAGLSQPDSDELLSDSSSVEILLSPDMVYKKERIETEEEEKDRLALENYFQSEKFFYAKLFSEDRASARANLVLYSKPKVLVEKRRRENENDSELVERLILDLAGLFEQYIELCDLLRKGLPNLASWLPGFAVRSEWPTAYSNEFVKKVNEVLGVKTQQIFSRLAFLSDCAYQINEAINFLEKKRNKTE